MEYTISITNLSKGVLMYIKEEECKLKYIIRVYRDFEFLQEAYHVVMQDDRECINVSQLLNSTEEELFQLSCVSKFDVNYVLAAVKYLRAELESTSTDNYKTEKERVIELHF